MTKKQKEDEVILTPEEQVWEIIEFARGLSSGMGYITPELINSRMKEISLNPMQATEATLTEAMKDPSRNEAKLQAFSQSFETQSMVYKRLLSYLSNMLAFDITYTSNADTEDFGLPKYKKDLKMVESLLERFEYKKEFKIVIKELLRNDAYFGCLRDTGAQFILQELPSDYCKITGRWEGGFLFSFNMYWFLLPGVEIDMYPPFFKKKYKEIWEKSNTNSNYDPSLPPELRGGSSWVYWVDVPVNVGVCFKLSQELATRLPYFSPLFNDLVLQGLMRNLQKNMNMSAASKMIMGEVPMLNKEAKASVRDSIAISPELLGKFMALVNSAIAESIKVASAPLTDIKGISFDSDNDMYDSYLRTALASSGVNSNLIFSSNIKPNAIETQLSLGVDEQMMESLYPQFNQFMNYFVSKFTKTYKFLFNFEGTEFYLNRANRLKNAMTLFAQGIVLPQKIAASLGMKPSHLIKQMKESKFDDFMGMLTPPSIESQKQMLKVNPALGIPAGTSTSTQKTSGEASKGKGRPRKDDSELSEDGLSTRDQGTNIGRGGVES